MLEWVKDDQFFNNYLSSNFISWLDPESKPGFERKFSLLMGFLNTLVKQGLEDFAGWRIWRLCHLKELRDQMMSLRSSTPRYMTTGSLITSGIESKNLKVYEKLWTYGDHEELHLSQKQGRLSEHAKETSRIAAKSRKGVSIRITAFTEPIFRTIHSNRAKLASSLGSGRVAVLVHHLMSPNLPSIQPSNAAINPVPTTARNPAPNPGGLKRVLSIAEIAELKNKEAKNEYQLSMTY